MEEKGVVNIKMVKKNRKWKVYRIRNFILSYLNYCVKL